MEEILVILIRSLQAFMVFRMDIPTATSGFSHAFYFATTLPKNSDQIHINDAPSFSYEFMAERRRRDEAG